MATSTEVTAAPQEWAPPSGDQEFVFEGMESVPSWVNKSWAGYHNGPALQLPDDVYGGSPYTTTPADIGDTVKFVAATPARQAHFVVIKGEPTGDMATKRPPQYTNASEEDLLKGGWITPDDLGPDAKAQIIARSPHLRRLIEDGVGAPEPVNIGDIIKTS